jgi:hypothetical protein
MTCIYRRYEFEKKVYVCYFIIIISNVENEVPFLIHDFKVKEVLFVFPNYIIVDFWIRLNTLYYIIRRNYFIV